MIDFEAQIAELNASSARRSAILAEMGRAEKAGQRVSEQLKAKPKVSLAEVLKRRAVAKPKAVPQPQQAASVSTGGKSWKPTSRLGPMLKEFYEPDPRRNQELLVPGLSRRLSVTVSRVWRMRSLTSPQTARVRQAVLREQSPGVSRQSTIATGP